MPPTDFFSIFSTPQTASGVVIDLLGRITKQFSGELSGRLEGNVFHLHEEFRFSDGDVYRRDWQINKLVDDHYTATAVDVVGTARAVVKGNVMQWVYPQRLAISKNGFVIGVKDYMVFGTDGTTIGYTKLTKWGIPLGKLITFFRSQ